MTTLKIDNPIFSTLRNNPAVNLAALQQLVSYANRRGVRGHRVQGAGSGLAMQHFSMVTRKLLQELNILKVAMQDLTPDSADSGKT